MTSRIKSITVLSLLLLTAQVLAHPMPKSLVEIRILESGWLLDMQLPTTRLEVAINRAETASQAASSSGIKAQQKTITPDRVREYIHPRIIVRSSEGASENWALSIVSVTLPISEESPFWNVQVQLTPPKNASQKRVEIEYNVIGKEIRTHEAVVTLMHDYAKSTNEQAPVSLAALRAHRRKLLIER